MLWNKKDSAKDLSQTPFGKDLATLLWSKLENLAVSGGISYSHRDYCGHGLIRISEGAAIFQIYDGEPNGPPLLKWTDRSEFVAYWASQSDAGLSGADINHPELRSSSDFERNNQRLTFERILQFLKSDI